MRSGILTPVLKIAFSVLAAALPAAGLAACGDSAPRPAGAPPDSRAPAVTASSDIPVPRTPRLALARNAAEADKLVGEGRADLARRLAALKGNPVVVNLWASWCGPCRYEFAFFAQATARYRERVAFVGVDVLDGREVAQAFVDARPPGFPSIYDGDGRAARSLGGGRVMPTTIFIGRDGRVTYRKLGGYASAADLDADVRRRALEAR